MMLRLRVAVILLALASFFRLVYRVTLSDGWQIGRLGMHEPRMDAANDAEKVMLASGYYQEVNLIMAVGLVLMLAGIAVKTWLMIRADREQSKPETLRSFLECSRKS